MRAIRKHNKVCEGISENTDVFFFIFSLNVILMIVI